VRRVFAKRSCCPARAWSRTQGTDRPAMAFRSSSRGRSQARRGDDESQQKERSGAVVDSVHHCWRRQAVKGIRRNECQCEHDGGEHARECEHGVVEEREERNEPRRVPRKEVRKRQREQEQCDPPRRYRRARFGFLKVSGESPQEGGKEQEECCFRDEACVVTCVRPRDRPNEGLRATG